MSDYMIIPGRGRVKVNNDFDDGIFFTSGNNSSRREDPYERTKRQVYAPKKISKIEAIIYDWVVDNFGTSEAMSPAWNITMLAEAIHENLNGDYEQSNTVVYENEGQYDDED